MENGFSSKGVSSKNEKAVMNPGLNVPAEFVEVRVEDKGDMIWEFKNEVGGLQHREFNIDPTHASYKEEYADSAMGRIKHLACGLLGEAVEAKIDAIQAPNFKAWAEQVAAIVNATPPANRNVELKIIVTKKNYIGLPLFPDFITSKIRPLTLKATRFDNFEFSKKSPDAAPDAGRTAPNTGGTIKDEDVDF